MRLRRYEILLPLFYNDGKRIEKEKFLVTHKELVEKFGAATTDTTKIVGKWIYQNQLSIVIPSDARNLIFSD